MSSTRATAAAPVRRDGHSKLAALVLVLTALSAVAFAVLAVGALVDWDGAGTDVTWSAFALGGVLALVLGVVAWLRGHRRASHEDVRAGHVAFGWLLCAMAISAIWSAFD